MGLFKDRLVFDAADLAVSDKIGSYLIGAGGSVLTSTTVGSDEALDINIVQSVGQYAEDSVHNSGDFGMQILAVRNDTLAALAGTDGDYAPLQVSASGALYVDIQNVQLNTEYAEDSAHSSGDVGAFMLAVRNDTEGSLADTDGDYAPLQVDSSGRLRTITDLDVSNLLVADDAADSGGSLKAGSRAVDGALAVISAANDRADVISDMYRRVFINDSPNIGFLTTEETVGATAAEIVATPLAGRRSIIVQNQGAKDIYLGHDASVTVAGGLQPGIRVAKGATLELSWGEDLNIFAISTDAGQSVVVAEVA